MKQGVYKIEDLDEGVSFKMMGETAWEHARAKTFFTKEPETVEWIRQFDGSGVFWDIGANIGVYSLYCAALYPEMTIYSFEPQKSNYERLCVNKKLNKFKNIRPYCTAVGKKDDVGSSFVPKRDEIGASGGYLEKNDGPVSPVVTGDYFEYVSSPPKYIKIDTDNNEADILEGCADLLYNHDTQGVLVEINEKEREMCKFMHRRGFFVDLELMRLQKRGEYAKNVIFRR
jgi:FkbM family methyltransferase